MIREQGGQSLGKTLRIWGLATAFIFHARRDNPRKPARSQSEEAFGGARIKVHRCPMKGDPALHGETDRCDFAGGGWCIDEKPGRPGLTPCLDALGTQPLLQAARQSLHESPDAAARRAQRQDRIHHELSGSMPRQVTTAIGAADRRAARSQSCLDLARQNGMTPDRELRGMFEKKHSAGIRTRRHPTRQSFLIEPRRGVVLKTQIAARKRAHERQCSRPPTDA